MLEEDQRSPSTEKIAVFQAISRVIRESSRKFVIMDTDQTKIMIVTLPETTPVLEASHLQDDLRRRDQTLGWIINSSLAAAETIQTLLSKRARSEHELIAEVRDELAQRYAVVPTQADEPVGVEKLGPVSHGPRTVGCLIRL
jgi:arsenite-transporting ATPase